MQVTEVSKSGLKRAYAIVVTAAELDSKVNEKLADAYAGLKEPALRRYGETTSRKDEVI